MSNDEPANPEPARPKIIDIFDRAASTYDQVGPRFFTHFGQSLVERTGIPKGARVLDIACGRGAILFPAALAVGPDGQVVGVDLAPQMVQETAKEVNWRKLTNIEVCQMDAASLQFPDISMDYILCGFAIFFFPHLEHALSEMRRVLKPNGRIAISVWEKSIGEQWAWFEEVVKEFLPPNPEPSPQSQEASLPEPELDTPPGLTEVLRAAGFTDIQVTAEAFESIYASESELWSSFWSHGTRGTLERIQSSTGTEGMDRFRSAVFQRMQGIKKTDGIHITWPALFAFGTKPFA